ncbi:MAG: hypothetical protein ACKVU4_15305 [Phycisphaerales bacterium]
MNSGWAIRAAASLGLVLVASAALRAQTCNHLWTAALHTGAFDFEVFDHGAGPRLYAVTDGSFSSNGVYVSKGIARWTGTGWENIGDLSPSVGYALKAYDHGAGTALYVGGGFYWAGGVVSPALARFSGRTWSAVSGFTYPDLVTALCVYDDGAGPALVVGGWFPNGVAGIPSANIAAWNGQKWFGLGGGVDSEVDEMEVFDDDGPGPNPPSLFVGGFFDYAGTTYASRIARWDGHEWHAVGPGMDPGFGNGPVRTLCVYDDGAGPALIAAGTFAGAFGVPGTKTLARWNGKQWSSIGTNNGQATYGLYVFDDGVRGPGLIVGGQFSVIGGLSVPGMARYDGTGWSALGGPNGGQPGAMIRHDEGGVPTLWVSGGFQISPGIYTALGRYQYVCEPCFPDCDASGALTIADFNCFQSKYVLGDPYADCNASGSLTVADFGCFQGKYVLGCP